jgi:hypothetical protein
LSIPSASASVAAPSLIPILAAELGPEKLEAFLARVPADETFSGVRASCFASLAEKRVSGNPQAIRQWSSEHLGDEAFRAGAIPVIARTMPPSEALNWIGQLPMDATGVVSSSLDIMENWMNTNSEAASGWLAAHADSVFYDEAAALIASNMAEEDSASAIAWAQSIKGNDRREALLQTLRSAFEATELR